MNELRENNAEKSVAGEMQDCTVIRAGTVALPFVDQEMRRLQSARRANEIPDTVIFVDHPEVVTIGRRSNRDGAVAPVGFQTYVVDRGGGLTWHGPGQLTVYPIFQWTLPGERSISVVIDRIEEWIIRSLSDFGVAAVRDARMHGVWVEEKKIASIGLSFQHWITRHGFTVNLDTPPGRVETVLGCGLPADTTTSVSRAVGRRITREEFEDALLRHMPEVVRRKLIRRMDTSAPPPWDF